MQTGIFILDSLQINPLQAVFFLLSIVIALTVHEFAHAAVAARQGDPTARHAGRVSLNPLHHLDPAGSFLFLIAGIGWGKPVPVNPYQLKDGKLGDFYVSIAGIISNLVLAFIAVLPFIIIRSFGGTVDMHNVGLQFAGMLFYVNCLIAAFNILPIPPLDGSKAIGILVPRALWPAYQRYLAVGPVLLIGIFMLAIVFHVNLLGWILDPLIALFQYVTSASFF